MKNLNLVLFIVPQILAIAIPAPIISENGLAASTNWKALEAENDFEKRQIIQIYEIGAAWIIGRIRAASEGTPPQTPGPDAPTTSVAPAATYDYEIHTRTTPLSKWAHTVHEDLLAMDIETPGGEAQIEQFLKEHMDILPPQWDILPIPGPCAACFKGKANEIPGIP